MSATCLFSKQPATVALASESSGRGEKGGGAGGGTPPANLYWHGDVMAQARAQRLVAPWELGALERTASCHPPIKTGLTLLGAGLRFPVPPWLLLPNGFQLQRG
jgi:hypothetical protein